MYLDFGKRMRILHILAVSFILAGLHGILGGKYLSTFEIIILFHYYVV